MAAYSIGIGISIVHLAGWTQDDVPDHRQPIAVPLSFTPCSNDLTICIAAYPVLLPAWHLSQVACTRLTISPGISMSQRVKLALGSSASLFVLGEAQGLSAKALCGWCAWQTRDRIDAALEMSTA